MATSESREVDANWAAARASGSTSAEDARAAINREKIKLNRSPSAPRVSASICAIRSADTTVMVRIAGLTVGDAFATAFEVWPDTWTTEPGWALTPIWVIDRGGVNPERGGNMLSGVYAIALLEGHEEI